MPAYRWVGLACSSGYLWQHQHLMSYLTTPFLLSPSAVPFHLALLSGQSTRTLALFDKSKERSAYLLNKLSTYKPYYAFRF